MFEVAEYYERQMGRWSRQLAPLLIEFAGVRDGDCVLDVGCGTGSLATTIVQFNKAAKVIGVDASKGFIEYARSRCTDSRVSFTFGDAHTLAYQNGSFDCCLSLLTVNHIANAPQAVREMRRVTKSGGVVATAMWDGSGGNAFNDCFWDAAIMLDSSVTRASERQAPIVRPRRCRPYGGASASTASKQSTEMPVGFRIICRVLEPIFRGAGPVGRLRCFVAGGACDALKKNCGKSFCEAAPKAPSVCKPVPGPCAVSCRKQMRIDNDTAPAACPAGLRFAIDEAKKAANISREIAFSEVADFMMLREAQREMGIK